MHDPIALAIPLFFLFIAIELVVAKRRRQSVYRLSDSVTDLSGGILMQVTGVWGTALQLAIYEAVFRHRLVSFGAHSVWPWILAFVGVDFLYYWWHRLSHEVNVLWAAHVVHHQSEEYNLSVALRQSVLTSWTDLPFYLPLALLGVPTLAFALSLSLSTLYQFWIHTRLVGKLGALESTINTPSHHRVHHAVNPRYLDRNYGAALILWDRLFGTFEPESEPCVYGLVKPLANFQPLWAQFHYFKDILTMVLSAPHFSDKVRVLVARPDWRPRDTPALAPAPQVSPDTFVKYDPPLSRARNLYLFGQVASVVVATFALVWWGKAWPAAPRLALGAAVVVSVFAMGALMEQARNILAMEMTRFTLLALAAGLLAPPMVAFGVIAWCVAAGVWSTFALRERAAEPVTQA